MGVTRYRVDVPGGLGDAAELRIAFASDFHAGPLTHPALLHRACGALDEVQPHLLLLGGDFVSFDASMADAVIARLAAVDAPLGRYAVLGNHDLLADVDRLATCLARAGIHLLTNRNVRLPSPYHNVWLCGLDDHLLGRPDARAAFAGADGMRLVLMHEPSTLLDIGAERFELAFCGHTHGGQVALPGGTPVYVPEGRLSRRFAYGPYKLTRGGTLIVSRGVGYTYLPVRAFAPPEVVACLVHSDSPSCGGADTRCHFTPPV